MLPARRTRTGTACGSSGPGIRRRGRCPDAPIKLETVRRRGGGVVHGAPKVDVERTAHLLLTVTDDGSPPLTRYHRLVVIDPTASAGTPARSEASNDAGGTIHDQIAVRHRARTRHVLFPPSRRRPKFPRRT